MTKLKVFADDKFDVAKMMIYVFDRGENIRKAENACYQHFLLFPQSFQRLSVSGSLQPGIMWEKVVSLATSIAFIPEMHDSIVALMCTSLA